MKEENKDCVFCSIIEKRADASIVFEDDQVVAIMDIQPVNPGHVLVIPKKHLPFIGPEQNQIGEYMFKVGIQIAAALKNNDLKCEGVNYIMADGEAAGQEVFHAHLHVFPRFKQDGFGFRFSEKYYNPPQRSELDHIASEIKNKLS
jgi:histidine triad (HIT) family protein